MIGINIKGFNLTAIDRKMANFKAVGRRVINRKAVDRLLMVVNFKLLLYFIISGYQL